MCCTGSLKYSLKLGDDMASKPTEKVQAGGYAGAGALVLIYVAGLLGLDLPAEVAASITLLIAGAGAWIKTEGAGWFRQPEGRHSAGN